jgi:hypothetical protein
MAQVRDQPPIGDGESVIDHLVRGGVISHEINNVGYNVHAAYHVQVPGIDHQVAEPFWNFMNATGPVEENGTTHDAPLFQDPFYATGYPVTEAYWADYKVGGNERQVLVQCFERRCLTYTPDNPAGWQVEAGNVGQHYYHWRYPEAPAGPNEQANQLAAAFASASTDDARYDALLDVMEALHIGVYTGTGEQVLGGAERGAGDFYLYDVELHMMASAYGRGDRQSVDSIAQTLTNIPLLEGGATLDPELLRQVLIAGAQQAQQTPDDPTSLLPLIVRQLGLMQPTPYDLFTDVPADQVQFDALQTFLILADILLPTVAAEGPVDVSSSQLVAHSNGVLKAIPMDATDVCSTIPALVGKEIWPTGKWAVAIAEKVGKFALKASMAIDIIHGEMLAFSIAVRPFEYSLETHWGHETPGKPLNFRTEVRMLDELPETLIKCGWILGVEFPKQGPIAGVTMLWYTPGLDTQGTITCEAACHQTGADGVATLTFQPFQEADPGQGQEIKTAGWVVGTALYQSKHNNLLGTVAQFVTPKYSREKYFVTRHEPPGWDITLDGTLDVSMSQTATLQGTNHTWTEHGTDKDHFVLHLHLSQVNLTEPNLHYLTIAEATSVGSVHYDVVGYGATSCDASWDDSWTGRLAFEPKTDESGVPLLAVSNFSVDSPNYEKYRDVQDCIMLVDQPYMTLAIQPSLIDSDQFGIVLTPGKTVIQADACDVIPGFHGKEQCRGTIDWTITVQQISKQTE